MMAMQTPPRENEVQSLAGVEMMRRAQGVERPVRAQVQVQRWLARRPYVESASCWLDRSTATWLERHPQPDGAVQNNGGPDKFSPAAGCVVSEICAGTDGHRIRDSHASVRGLKLGMEYRGVMVIVLTSLNNVFGRQNEVTARRDIEQSAKHGLRIETGKAQPGNTAVQADESRRRPVTNQPQIFESRVLAVAM